MCSQAEQQFPSRFQDDVVSRMGGHMFNSTKLNLALDIKANKSQETVNSANQKLNSIYTQTYKL